MPDTETRTVGLWAAQRIVSGSMWDDGPVREAYQRRLHAELVQGLVAAGGDLQPEGTPGREPFSHPPMPEYAHRYIDDDGEDQVAYLPTPAKPGDKPAHYVLRIEVRGFMPPEQDGCQ